MPVYSHSQLSTYKNCPLRYKLSYRDRIKRYVEGVEAFLGSRVHDVLKKVYDDTRLTRQNSLEDLLFYYDKAWQEKWHDAIVINRKDVTKEHYHNLGKKLIETYYQRYSPFDSERTIATELRLNFTLDDTGEYRMTGFVDRLSRTKEGYFQIHDYKSSANLPSQEDIDNDRQLPLYQIGVQKRWPDMMNFRLVWHYLAFDTEMVSTHSDESISQITEDTIRLIDEIKSTEEFLPLESGLCGWCEYPDLCPMRKHFYTVEALPVNEYLKEPGVTLVNKYAELRKKAAEIEEDTARVREAIVDYARREDVRVINGSDQKIRVRFEKQLKFPGKNESERQQLDKSIIEAGKWPEVSQLDTASLSRIVKSNLWDKELLDEVLKYGRVEETSFVQLSKLKDEELPGSE
ncbi:MAG: PD-(D/E)XK nuclease family protein [Dehalococcoidales bacterium]